MEELENMRAQMAVLKQKLDQQTIVTDQLLRKVTSERVKRLHRAIWVEGLSVLFVITFGNFVFYTQGCSIYFLIGTTIFMLSCFLATIIPHQRIHQTDIYNGDLLTVAHQVQKLRRLYDQWIYIAIPALMLWLGWYVWELYQIHQDNLKPFLGIIIGVLVGGCIGGLIGNHFRKKMIHEMDSIVEELG